MCPSSFIRPTHWFAHFVHGSATATTRDDLFSRAREKSKYEAGREREGGGGLKLLLLIHFKAKRKLKNKKINSFR